MTVTMMVEGRLLAAGRDVHVPMRDGPVCGGHALVIAAGRDGPVTHRALVQGGC